MNEEELRHRIKNAILVLKAGHPFNVGELTLRCSNENQLSVTGWTIKNDLKNMTKDTAVEELKETKAIFSRMISTSSELADFVNARQVEYCLGFDYGMGGIEICCERNGQLNWTTELKS